MLDFKQIIENSNLYNFHSHTQFCDGRADMEEFVVEAIKEGFTDYGFSPHSPIPLPSPCNMSMDAAKQYIDEFARLKSKYQKSTRLYMSMEVDYINSNWGPSNDYFKRLNLDYIIGSVHFIPSFDDHELYIDIDGHFDSFNKKMSDYFHNDIDSVVKSFYRQSMEMIECGGFDIIGHFDKIGHNADHFREGIENEDWYDKLVREEFDAIMDNHLIIEVNTKALGEHRRTFPNKKNYELLRKYNAPILINSDAHYPNLINAGRMETMAELTNMGIYIPAK